MSYIDSNLDKVANHMALPNYLKSAWNFGLKCKFETGISEPLKQKYATPNDLYEDRSDLQIALLYGRYGVEETEEYRKIVRIPACARA